MNYLAHLYLAEKTEESILGNFLGDFVKGRLNDQYSHEILKGIVTHRKIDAYTDSHERVKNCKNLISTKRRRWAGVITDILFDHYLSCNWSNYSEENLDEFIDYSYSVLLKNVDIVPDNAKKIIPSLIKNNWLEKYRTVDGISLVFDRMSKRVKVENTLKGSEEELVQNYDNLKENFEIFFPQLVDYVEEVRKYI